MNTGRRTVASMVVLLAPILVALGPMGDEDKGIFQLEQIDRQDPPAPLQLKLHGIERDIQNEKDAQNRAQLEEQRQTILTKIDRSSGFILRGFYRPFVQATLGPGMSLVLFLNSANRHRMQGRSIGDLFGIVEGRWIAEADGAKYVNVRLIRSIESHPMWAGRSPHASPWPKQPVDSALTDQAKIKIRFAEPPSRWIRGGSEKIWVCPLRLESERLIRSCRFQIVFKTRSGVTIGPLDLRYRSGRRMEIRLPINYLIDQESIQARVREVEFVDR